MKPDMTSAFSVGRNAGLARVADAPKNMTLQLWAQNGSRFAHRVYQNDKAIAEFVRGFTSAYTAR